MLYDLNIAWSPSISTTDLERTLRFSSQLGYNVVALNHNLDAPLPSQISNSIPPFAPQTSSFQPENRQQPIPTILRRLTVNFSDPSQNQQLPKAAQAYDILALRPQTEKAFQAACLTVSTTEVSIISLDLTVRLPFHLRPKPCMAAVARGLRFEIAYGQTLRPGADDRARATFAGNVIQLVRATRGRGLIVSSEAADTMALRAPVDIVNLLAVWGLPTDKGMEALGVNPRGVVVNEGIKRSGFRGVVDIVNVAGRSEEEQSKLSKGKDREVVEVKDNKKRKNGGGETAEKGGDGGAGENAPVSKRQAKKLKAALRKKEVEEKGAQ
ncbi:putative ribonuclease P protein subunit 3 [Daldinia childiae]|uniref:putative ribonuclease P protein subunit 3 n=1 Tax=Daldinia childiae TaxID=326645 RepID=UPI001444F9FD|nr:putative ribonuclease P protein subunit 3 [Daldinia childiae]KAF3057334.1 putative ribonuclease P protein subunit 3 [Daldinia childiae]